MRLSPNGQMIFSAIFSLICMGILTIRSLSMSSIVGMAVMTTAIGGILYGVKQRSVAIGVWIGVVLFVILFVLIDQMNWIPGTENEF